MTASAPPIIEVKDVRKVFSVPNGEVVALNRINLSINQGDIYGIIGLSGAGKSTLIRCINRLDEPTEGSIFISGENILTMKKKDLLHLRRSISMIFQHFNLLMQETVSKNIRYPLDIAGVSKSEGDKRVKELLTIVGLEDKALAYPAQLSGGQKQRVAIARALASNPQVLLCDEATSALDPMTTQSILTLLQNINRNMGITIVLITHEMAVIRQICTRVAIMDGGEIAEEGNVNDVFTHTKSAAGRRLFGIVPSEGEIFDGDIPTLRIVFDGAKVGQPIIGDLTLALQHPFSILAADVRTLNGVQYGQMIIQKPDDPVITQKALSYLKNAGLTVEEVQAP